MISTLQTSSALAKKGRLFLLTNKMAQAQEALQQLEALGPLDLNGALLKLKFAQKTEQLANLDPAFIREINQRFELNTEINAQLAAYYAAVGDTTEAYRLALHAHDQEAALKLISHLDDLLPEEQRQQIKMRTLGELNGYQRIFPLDVTGQCVFGQSISINNKEYAVGMYDRSREERTNSGILSLSGEQQRMLVGCELLPGQAHTQYQYQADEKCLLPIMPTHAQQPINITVNDEHYLLHTLPEKRFHYLPFNAGDNLSLSAQHPVMIGDPITLRRESAGPALVLTIFVDGLSQKFIEQEGGLSALMPNTAAFFAEGTQFENCYSSGEWTYVSLASIFSGLYTYNHRMFHPAKDSQTLLRTPTYTEVFQQAGYFCSQISGDWRSTPVTGYGKGMDRFLYQPAMLAMDSRHVIQETLEHLDTFGEKNNWMWICLPDLHDIADEFTTSISHQAKTPLAHRVSEKTGETSVRKKRSAAKVFQYREQVAYVDRQLKVLFDYIRSHYEQNDIIVSLVSDHGQSYLIESDFFMDEERTKVPLYMTGRNIPAIHSQELVQHFDLFRSVLHCAGIPDPLHNDANLPQTLGGSTTRSQIFTESLFPDAPYYACIIDERHKYCLTSQGKTSDDGMIDLGQIETQLFCQQENADSEEERQAVATQMLNQIIRNTMPFINK
ncbi:sulfatase-like hydrolase/transferase [Plesiomonas shigelloides]|uniref:sulfatase-like hydrolase/transferase n=1 Tax=Plesiomonas shigelloides TaxID=703 RepID=UPI001C040CFA|nr:sulfatase-like hydrolase/transferase [Plesiomonas shigelloides]QWK97147.1 sulfatase-like hydrolase/transferase [Plesiomonas shigelloides]